MVHHLQCQGHSKDFYNKNMTVSTISSKLMVYLQTNLILIVQHQKLEFPVEKLDDCIQDQGYSEG